MTRLAVFGAGAIGCWVGGRLASGGADVTLIGRARLQDELARGLHVTELHGRSWTVHPTVTTTPEAAATADVVLVTVKSAGTAEAGRALAACVPPGGVVISLQNGIRNVDVLRAALPDRTVLPGMVPFNVIRPAPGRFRQASAGTLVFAEHDRAAPLSESCLRADLPFELRHDMPAVQWGKLLLNLNNAINALSGVPLAAELGQVTFRRCLAAAQREALAVLRAARVPVARVTPLPPSWLARLLALPDALFRPLQGRVVAIDPAARSSMWDDLEAGRPTEVDYIQGEIVALAEAHGRDAPLNRALARLVHEAEAGGTRTFTGPALCAALGIDAS